MSVVSKEKLLRKLSKKAYRDAYAEESVKTSLPFQIKAMREQRDWSQAVLGNQSAMKQNAVSRLESAEYGNLSINILLRLANAFDCGLLVKFVPFSRLVREFEDVSPSSLEVKEFADDFNNLQFWSSSDSIISSKTQNRKLLGFDKTGKEVTYTYTSENLEEAVYISEKELNSEKEPNMETNQEIRNLPMQTQDYSGNSGFLN